MDRNAHPLGSKDIVSKVECRRSKVERRRTASAVLGALVISLWTPCVNAGQPLTTTLVAGGLTNPTYLAHAPGDARLFVLERAGRVRLIINGALQSTSFLDITSSVSMSGEGGLLGIAFHPNYSSNRKFYVHYTAPGLVSTVAEYEVSAGNPNVASPASARIILTQWQPATNHNAGWIGFSPVDDYLYIPFGDGGGGGGPQRAQTMTAEWLGKLLRIDVNSDGFPADSGRNYAIPADNPFVGATGDDEIWALGLRNPYRASFDRETGDLWIGDVGSSNHEEVDFQSASSNGGENYGWGCMEGVACTGSFCTCNAPNLTLPVHDYLHSAGNCVVTGGAVYRGCAIADLVGTYFFADYCSGRIWSFRYDGGAVTDFQDRTTELDPPAHAINSVVAIGEDASGELYFVDLGGEIFKLVPASGGGSCIDADIDGDGTVGFSDLTALLLAWGPCSSCVEDLDDNGSVGFGDLTLLLVNWG